MQRGFAGILVLILIVLTIAGGAYYLETQKVGLGVTITSPSPTASSGETTNWKTYTNIKYNFSIKYPDSYQPGWGTVGSGPTEQEIRESGGLSWILSTKGASFAIFGFRVIGPCTSTLNNCFTNFKKSESFGQESLKVENSEFLNKEAVRANYIQKGSGISDLLVKEIFFVHSGNLWMLDTQVDSQASPERRTEIENEINKIFSTLKLTN